MENRGFGSNYVYAMVRGEDDLDDSGLPENPLTNRTVSFERPDPDRIRRFQSQVEQDEDRMLRRTHEFRQQQRSLNLMMPRKEQSTFFAQGVEPSQPDVKTIDLDPRARNMDLPEFSSTHMPLSQTTFDPHFIDMVDAQHFTHRIDVRVPGQMSHEMREMFRKTQVGHLGAVGKGGVLTSSLAAYKIRAGHSHMEAVRTGDYQFLQQIQTAWIEDRTWGESWGQLGQRGVLSSALIKTAQWLNNSSMMTSFYQVKENSDARFLTVFRPKPVRESTVFADHLRSAVDYVEAMEMNLLGFYTTTTIYSGLYNFSLKVGRGILAATTGKPFIGAAAQFAGRVLDIPVKAGRLVAADVGASLFSRVGNTLDVLMGAGPQGSFQLANDRGVRDLSNLKLNAGAVAQRAMHSTIAFNRNNPLMKLSGVGVMSEFFDSAQRGYRKFIAAPKKDIRLLLRPIVMETTGKDVKARVRSGAGLKVSLGRVASLGIFGAIALDKLTGYLGEHLGGVDAFAIDRANQILRDAAAKTGMHPVQIARSGNASFEWTGNKYVDALSLIPRAGVNGMWALATDTWEQLTTKATREVLGPNIVQQGREMEAAQKAALMGNQALAEAYMLMSVEGPGLYRDETFRADMWKSWVMQITPNPGRFTFTWSMSQHRGGQGRSPYSLQQQEVQEFGFTLQGPVMLSIGLSVDMPWEFRRELGKDDQQNLGHEAWTFYYKPGSSFSSAVGAITLLHALDMTFATGSKLVGNTLKRVISPAVSRMGFHGAAGTIRALGDIAVEAFGNDHRFMVEPYKAGSGGPRLASQARIGAFKATARLLSLPMTLPIQAGMLMLNMPAGLAEQAKWAWFRKVDYTDMAKYLGSGKLSPLGQLFSSHVEGTWWVNHATRETIRAGLNSLDVGTVEKYAATFGHDGFDHYSPDRKALVRASWEKYHRDIRKISREFRIPGFHELGNYLGNKNISRITKGVTLFAQGSILGLVGYSMYLAFEANQSAYKNNELQASQAYNLANKVMAWQASLADLNRADQRAGGSPFYQFTEKHLNYNEAWPIFRGLIAAARHAVLLADPAGGFRNLRMVAAGVYAEGFLFPSAGFFMDELKWDPNRDMMVPKEGVFGQRPGVGSLMMSWATGLLNAFQKGFYSPMGQNPYAMMGPFGATKREVDKDREEWAGWFAQGGILIFLTSGYAEQFIFKTGWEKRRHQQWKYVQDQAYSPFGMRQLMRDKAMRTGRMYHDDVLSDATTWGVRTELTRRATMFQWIRHVDARDLAFVPGILSAHHGTQYATSSSVRTFREPRNDAEAAFNALVAVFAPDVVGANTRPGELADAEDQLELNAVMVQNKKYTDWFGRPNTMTPMNFEANVFHNPVARFAVLALAGMGVVKVGAFLVEQVLTRTLTSGPGSVSQMVGSWAEKLGMTQVIQGSQQLAKLRAFTPQARTVKLNPTELMALRIGTVGDGDLYVKGLRGAPGSLGYDAALKRNGSTLNDIFWTQAELDNGPLRTFYTMLNKSNGTTQSLAMMANTQRGTYAQLTSARTAMQGLVHDVTSILERSPELREIESVQRIMTRLHSGAEQMDAVVRGMAQGLWEGGLGRATKTFNLAKEIVVHEGRSGSVLERIRSAHAIASELPRLFTQELEDIKMLRRIGPESTGALHDALKAYGIKKATFDELSELQTIQQRMGQKGVDDGIDSVRKQPFMEEARRRFNARMMTEVVKDLQKLEDPGHDRLRAFLGAIDDAAAVDERDILARMVDVATNPSKRIDFESRGGIKGALESLRDQNKITKEMYEEMVNKKLKDMRAWSAMRVGGDMLQDAAWSGAEVKFGGKTHVISAKGVLFGGLVNTAMGAMFLANPVAEAAYYAHASRDPYLTADDHQLAYKKVYEARNQFIGNFMGLSAAALAHGKIMTRGLQALRMVFPQVGAGGGPVGWVMTLGMVVVDTLIIEGVSRAIQAIGNAQEEAKKIAEGRELSNPSAVGSLLQATWGLQVKIFDNMEQWSRQLEEKRLTNKKLTFVEQTKDFLINGMWDPSKLERPQGGIGRFMVDIIYREREKAAAGEGLGAGSSIQWRRPGGSPSLDQKSHGAFFAKSVFWVGNTYDLGRLLAAKQALLAVDAVGAWDRTLVHPTLHGILPMNLQVGPNKDGSDPLGPGWMRDDFRGQMFRPTNMMTSRGIVAELTRRGEFGTQILTNFADQRALMGKVIKTHPQYDPRSGAGLPADTFLVSVVDPTRFHMIFAQPSYHNPALQSTDPHYTELGKAAYRGKAAAPIQVRPQASRGQMPKSKENKTSAKVSAAPNQPMLSAHEIKKDLMVRALEVIAGRNQQKVEQTAKAKQSETDSVVYVVPAATPYRVTPHEMATDTSRKQSIPGPFAYRQAQVTSNGITLPGTKCLDPLDQALFGAVDTIDMSSERLWNDSMG